MLQADLNGDGEPEIIVATHGSKIQVSHACTATGQPFDTYAAGLRVCGSLRRRSKWLDSS